MNFQDWIGKKIKKSAGKTANIKPFKSRLMVNTVKGLTIHEPLTSLRGENVYAFTFEEDDSYVECERCELV